jgi:hypothetical protein
VCKVIHAKKHEVEAIAAAVGDDAVEGLGAALQAVSEAWTAYVREDYRMFVAAQEVGITPEQWTLIRGGRRAASA